MSPAIRHKYKYSHSTVQRAKDRRQKFHFCRSEFDLRPRNVKLNLSNLYVRTEYLNFSNQFGRITVSHINWALTKALNCRKTIKQSRLLD